MIERLSHWISYKLYGSPGERGIRAGGQFFEGYQRGIAKAQVDLVWKDTLVARANERVEFAKLRVEDARNELIEAHKELARAESERAEYEGRVE